MNSALNELDKARGRADFNAGTKDEELYASEGGEAYRAGYREARVEAEDRATEARSEPKPGELPMEPEKPAPSDAGCPEAIPTPPPCEYPHGVSQTMPAGENSAPRIKKSRKETNQLDFGL